MELTVELLVREAQTFSTEISEQNHPDLIGVTDGKAIGTYVEHLFRSYLLHRYELTAGNSASGIDLPSVNTDIKATGIKQPQSSCPFKSARQKIYGLGYNLLVFVYNKTDTPDACSLKIVNCTFIDAERTADFSLTAIIREMLSHGANKEDFCALLNDLNLPGDEITYSLLADEIRNCVNLSCTF